MLKTPISKLTEFAAKHKRKLPTYEMVQDGSVASDKYYIYRVLAFDLDCTGKGRSKMDAKHEAARNLLYLINFSMYDNDGDIEEPQNITRDAASELIELCTERKLPKPTFEIINTSGPAHCPSFTFECKVLYLSEQASYSNKKQAKQLVAEKMVKRIQDNIELVSSLDLPDISVIELKEQKQTKIKTYMELKNKYSNYNPTKEINNRHNYFYNLPQSIKNKIFILFTDKAYNSKEKIQRIFKELNMEYDIVAGDITEGYIFAGKGEYNFFIYSSIYEEIWQKVIDFLYEMFK